MVSDTLTNLEHPTWQADRAKGEKITPPGRPGTTR